MKPENPEEDYTSENGFKSKMNQWLRGLGNKVDIRWIWAAFVVLALFGAMLSSGELADISGSCGFKVC